MAKNIAGTVFELATPIAKKLGLKIWDVEFVKEGADYYLRVYIDKDGIITTDDCEKFSRTFDPILDEEDPIDHSYCFEVSSPGMERLLSRPEHFEKYIGEKVRITLYRGIDGHKEYIGNLISVGTEVTIEFDGQQKTFEKKNCAAIRLCCF